MTVDGSGINNAYIDFHSSGLGAASSRIISTGGTSTYANGTLGIVSGIINITSKTTMNLTAGGNILLGSPTSYNTMIRGTDGLIIGRYPTTYNPTTGSMSSPGFRMAHATNTALIDFHTNELGGLNFDSRILAQGGTMAENDGTLSLSSGTMNYTAGSGHNFNGGINCGGAVRFNNGFSFNQGYFTSNMFFTGGGVAISRNLGANTATTESIYFGVTFLSGVILSVSGYSSDAASMGVVTNFYGTSTTGFTATFYNSRSVTAPSGTWGINWMAFGYI